MSTLSDDVRSWIAENLLRGCTPEQLIEVLAERGVPREVSAKEIEEAQAHPYMKAANKDSNSAATIFVSIAAYRDPELLPTIRDLFAKAKYPENIHVGVCWQYDPLREEPFTVPDRKSQVSVINIDFKKARGVCWARHLIQKLYGGEEYYLQTDAHSRFIQNWDVLMVGELQRCPSPRAILSTYPNHYTLPDTLVDHGPYKLVFNKFYNKVPVFHSRFCDQEEKKSPSISALASAGFVFCKGSVILEVPYDPYLYFIGEEILHSVRYWTHGYDLYTPSRTLMFHLYGTSVTGKNQHWQDYPDWHTNFESRSRARVMHLLGIEAATSDDALAELNIYGLGNVRSLAEYEAYAGVNFKNQYFSASALAGNPRASADLQHSSIVNEDQESTIFVSIAAYRDQECVPTIRDLFAKASHPERIYVGVCWQYDPATEPHELQYDGPYASHVRTVCYPASESKGAGWARAEATYLRGNETYILQIDAHMRFERSWDEILIDMLEKCPTENAVISTFLPGYDSPETLNRYDALASYVKVNFLGQGEDTQLIHLSGALSHTAYKFKRSPFWVGNFLFMRNQVLGLIPVDPYIYFYGEEITYSARLWTHGYDVFQPNEIVIYHCWSRTSPLGSTYKNYQTERQMLTLKRVKHLLSLEKSDDKKAIVEIKKYGLGKKRSLASFWTFAGIDLTQGTIEEFAKNGEFDEAYERALAQNV